MSKTARLAEKYLNSEINLYPLFEYQHDPTKINTMDVDLFLNFLRSTIFHGEL